MTYDGYGRPATSHSPIQSSGTSTGVTYNADDSVATKTDARGVQAVYAYNNRGLSTSISYPGTAPTDVTETATATYTYDAAGNRTAMTDGMGSTSYQYDQLSRIASESRVFTGLGSTAYTLSYGYNLAGQVTSITDPWNAQVGYTRSITGRLSSVTGDGYASGADYVSELKYRAWGGLKSMTYASGAQTLLTYTNRLQPSNFKLNSSSTQLPSPSLDIDYSYTADGLMRLSTDHKDATLDRAYGYDNLGRLTSAFTASEARSWVQSGGQTYGSTVDGPYRQTFALDAWDNTTQKFGRSFTSPNARNQTVIHSYDSASGRVSGWSYDADGRFVDESASPTSERKYYDEAGLLRSSGLYDSYNIFDYDGDGQKAKSHNALGNFYLLRSSVIGQAVAEIMAINGTKFNGFVYAEGDLVAIQYPYTGQIFWQHTDVSGKSVRTTDANQDETGRDELDPSGVKVDGPGQEHHGGGSGGGGHDPGGAQARIASLSNLSMVDVGGILVPFAIAGSVQQHLGSMSEQMINHWNGWTTEQEYWVITFGDGGKGTGVFDFNHKKREKKKTIPKGPPRRIRISEVGIKDTFNENDMVTYEKKRQESINALETNEECRSYLAGLGIDVAALIDAVRLQRPFDGSNSTLTRLEAGVINPTTDLTDERQLSIARGSISGDFVYSHNDAEAAIWTGPSRKLGETVGDRSDVYFRSNYQFQSGIIIHEALHSFLKVTDPQLADKLGVTIRSNYTKPITDILTKHGCGK